MAAVDDLAGLSVLNAGDPNGLVAARRKKEQALYEMQRSLELQAGDPKHTFSGATNADIAHEQGSLDEDSDFGTEATARTKAVQDENADMSDYNRPDVTKKRDDEFANKLALATVPNVEAAKVAGTNQINLANTNAKNESTQRNDTLKAYLGMGDGGPGVPKGSQKTVHIGANGDPTISIAPPKAPGQLEQRTISMIHEGTPLVNKLDEMLGNPSSDPLSQLISKGRNTVTQTLFDHGIGTPDQAKQDLEGLLAVLGSSSYVVGSRSYQLIKQAMAHLTSGSASDSFNKTQLQTIKHLWPQMLDEVQQAHLNPNGPVDGLTPGAPDPAGIR